MEASHQDCKRLQVPSLADVKANVDDWHTDSYPIVAIVLLSNPSPGGETCCMTADGVELPLNFPTAGSCIVLQVSLTPRALFVQASHYGHVTRARMFRCPMARQMLHIKVSHNAPGYASQPCIQGKNVAGL